MEEYAKFVRLNFLSANSRGCRTVLSLPRNKSMAHDGDFINFYCGLGPFECGISTKRNPFFSERWHWFANALPESGEPINMKAPPVFKDGDTIKIALFVDENCGGKIKFLVNGRMVHISRYSYKGQNNARLVLACAQATRSTEHPLAPWGIYHDWVIASQVEYKNAFHVWREISAQKTTVDVFRLPGPKQVPDAACPKPSLYTITPLADGTIAAMLPTPFKL